LYEQRILIPADRRLRDLARRAYADAEQAMHDASTAISPRTCWTSGVPPCSSPVKATTPRWSGYSKPRDGNSRACESSSRRSGCCCPYRSSCIPWTTFGWNGNAAMPARCDADARAVFTH
jgi:hypothetical protein